MPTQRSTFETSETGDGVSPAPSVLDFLYHDSRRIGSFLAQFEGDGHLQQLTRTKAGARGKKEGSASDLKGTAGFLSGARTGSIETSVDLNEGHSRVFDPFWANARAFLNYVSEFHMLESNLTTATIGQFVTVTGWLSILDLAMLKGAWKIPSLQKKILSGVTDGRPISAMTAKEKAVAREAKDNAEMFIDFLQVLPHSVHGSMVTSEEEAKLVWCTLREEYLTTPAAELTLAHGPSVSGEWSIVGILSANPDFGVPAPTHLNEGEPGMLQSVMGVVSQQLSPLIRVALGRPAAAFSVTPLLIFRKVA